MQRTAPPRRNLAPAPAAIEASLALIIEPGQVTELRILDAVTISDRRPHIESGYFDDAAALANAAAGIERAKGWYITPNAVNPALLARAANRLRPPGKDPTTSDRDIVSRRWVLIDLDAERPAGISASDREHGAALARARTIRDDLAADGWPDPIFADSGNGAHLMYRVELPADDGGTIERCLAALDARHGTGGVKVDKTVHNPARIWKLYGTPAGKGDSTDDRPHRMARIIEPPDTLRVVPRDLLDALAASAPTPEPPPPRGPIHRANGHGPAFDLPAWLAQHHVPVGEPEPWQGGERWIFAVCPWNENHTNRCAYVLRHASGAVSAGCHHDGCRGRDWHALRDVYQPGWRDQKATINGTARKPNPTARRAATIEPYQPFPVEALPEPIRGFVSAGAAATRCDESYVALPLLSALTAAIGNTRRLQVKKTWHAPPILWTCIVGESGDGKSPPMHLALRPVMAAQKKALRKYDTDHAAWETMLDEWEHARRGEKRSGKTPRPVEPVPVRYVVSDTTVEALASRLADQPRGLLLARDELAGWLRSHDAYRGGKGGDTAHWLSMFDGGELIVDRKGGSAATTKRPIYVGHASVCITGGIQPAVLARALGDEHFADGLAARLLFAFPPRRRKKWTEADVDRQTERAIEDVFARLYALAPDVDDDDEPRPRLVLFTAAGKRAWVHTYDALADESADLTGDLAAAASKLEGYVPRLALIIHCLRQAAGELDDEAGVDEASVEAAATLTRWFGREARRIYAVLRESPADQETRRLLEWIAGRGRHATARDLQRANRRYATADEAESALRALAELGYGEWHLRHPHTGRPASAFSLFSRADADTTAPNTAKSRVVSAVGAEKEPEPADCEAGQ